MTQHPTTPRSVCPHDCPSACSVELVLHGDGRLKHLRGSRAQPYTDGVICAKVARYAERLYHPERLTQPLRRTGAKGAGEFTSISWDEALEEVAEQFRNRSARLGSESVWPYYYAGTMGLLQRDGINRLRHAMGYSRQYNTICSALGGDGWYAGTGARWGTDARDMLRSEVIVIWGCNAAATQVHAMHLAKKARSQSGAKIVVVDPCRTQTAEQADLHVAPRPGTDGALACAVMQVLFAEGMADRPYLQRHTDADENLERHLATRTPEWAAPITGLSADTIRQFARLYGSTKRSFIRLGYGFSRQRNGAQNVHAVSCLPALTGAWTQPGGGALLSSGGNFRIDKTLIEGLDLSDQKTRQLDMSQIGEVLHGNPAVLGGGPPVSAMLIQNTNPAEVAPDSLRVRTGLAREDLFLCVHEQFMTATAKYADIVLPATMFLEHDDLYTSYGHTFLQPGLKQLEPPPGCRSNHEVISDLARRLGANHPGFEMSAVEVLDQTLAHSDLPDLRTLVAEGWFDCARSFERMNFLDGFGWPDGRFRFQPDWQSLGARGAEMAPLPDYWSANDEVSEARPYRLITPPAHHFLNSTFAETPSSQKLEHEPLLLIHPEDAGREAVQDGAGVQIGNDQGAVSMRCRVTDTVKPGCLAVPGIWPGHHFREGVGINALVSSQPGWPKGGAVFHDTSVWLRVV